MLILHDRTITSRWMIDISFDQKHLGCFRSLDQILKGIRSVRPDEYSEDHSCKQKEKYRYRRLLKEFIGNLMLLSMPPVKNE